MKRATWALLLAIFAAALTTMASAAAKKQLDTKDDQVAVSRADASDIPLDIKITDGSVKIGGRELRYQAETGMQPIYDNQGIESAEVFSVSYLVTNDHVRPVTFIYNGGPGSSSIYLHAGVFGPRVLSTPGKGVELAIPPYRLTENHDSILDLTDLVFVDPVGTGYSRSAAPEGTHEFWGVNEDVRSLGEFVRIWLTRHKRWGDPVYLIGESYGGMRTARLGEYLESIGIMPSGLILLSPVLSYQELYLSPNNYRPYIHMLPTMAAIAQYHGKLSADLQRMLPQQLRNEVKAWANRVYQAALWKGNDLSGDEHGEVLKGLARYTGISAADIEAVNLRISDKFFSAQLLKGKRLCTSVYDGRITASGAWTSYDDEPSSAVRGAPYYSAFMRYLTDNLGLQTDRLYVMINQDAFSKWDFSSATTPPGSYPEVTGSLSHLMLKVPFVKVFVACGRYDLVTPLESTAFCISRLDLPEARRNTIEIHDYEGGHMMYLNPLVRTHMKTDLAAFYKRP